MRHDRIRIAAGCRTLRRGFPVTHGICTDGRNGTDGFRGIPLGDGHRKRTHRKDPPMDRYRLGDRRVHRIGAYKILQKIHDGRRNARGGTEIRRHKGLQRSMERTRIHLQHHRKRCLKILRQKGQAEDTGLPGIDTFPTCRGEQDVRVQRRRKAGGDGKEGVRALPELASQGRSDKPVLQPEGPLRTIVPDGAYGFVQSVSQRSGNTDIYAGQGDRIGHRVRKHVCERGCGR